MRGGAASAESGNMSAAMVEKRMMNEWLIGMKERKGNANEGQKVGL